MSSVLMRLMMCSFILVIFWSVAYLAGPGIAQSDDPIRLNEKADGYRGIWYGNQPSDDEYAYKYSGGMGTYCAKHKPFAIYSEEANKTFFLLRRGDQRQQSKVVAHGFVLRPRDQKPFHVRTILLDKKNKRRSRTILSFRSMIQVTSGSFSTSHGTSRPSYIHRSVQPYDIDEFELVKATRENRPATEVDRQTFS